MELQHLCEGKFVDEKGTTTEKVKDEDIKWKERDIKTMCIIWIGRNVFFIIVVIIIFSQHRRS